MANKKIEFDLVGKVHLEDIEKQLRNLHLEIDSLSEKNKLKDGFKEAADAARILEDALHKATNTNLNGVNFTKFDNEIKKSGQSLEKLLTDLNKGGTAGQVAFDNITRSLVGTNMELKKGSKILDSFLTTFKNTVRYGISSSIFNRFTGSIQEAYNYTKKLDTALTDIRIVSDKSADDMARFAVNANRAAQALGRSTLDYAKAATIYYQQGLQDEDVLARTNVTLKAANVTGQSASEVSEQLTAVWNGYRVSATEAESYIDKLAAVAASTASDLEELSTGMSKVASAANSMGVDVDQLNAQLSTIISVTRQAPESVGTALRTIYARMGDIKAGLDDETTLGNYTSKMAALGVRVLDTNGELRDMGEIIEEVGSKWSTLTREQQVSLTQVMAGTRQYNNLLALFENWDKYTTALNTSRNAAGKLQEQQDLYMESTEAHLQKLSTEAERTYAILFDQETVKTFADAMTGLVGIFNNFFSGIGGGMNALTNIGGSLVVLFRKQLGDELIRITDNWDRNINNFKKSEEVIKKVRDASYEAMYGKESGNADRTSFLNVSGSQGINFQKRYLANTNELSKDMETLSSIQKGITEEQFKTLQAQIQEKATAKDRLEYYKQAMEFEEAEGQNVNDVLDKWRTIDDYLNGKNNGEQEYIEKLAQELELEIDIEKVRNGQGQGVSKTRQKIHRKRATWEEVKKQHDYAKSGQKQRDEEAEEQTNANLKENKQLAERNIRMQKFVQYTGAAIEGMTALVGSMSVLGRETATAEERANALTQGFVGIGAAAADMVAPPAGAIVRMAGGLLEALGVTKLLASWFETAAEKAARIAKEVQEASLRYSQYKENLENELETLQKNVENYQTIEKSLDNLVKGTDEWNKATQNLNSQVLELMKTYPELAKYITNNNGLLEIQQEGYESLIKAQEKLVTDANLTALGNQIGVYNANIESTRQNLLKDLDVDTLISNNVYNKVGQAEEEQLIKAVMDAYNRNPNLFNKNDANELRKIISQNTSVNESTTDSLVKYLQENSEAIINATNAINNQNLGKNQYAQQYIAQFLNEDFKDSPYKDIIGKNLADLIASEEFDTYFRENYSDENSSLTDAEAQEWYRKRRGYLSVENLDTNQGRYVDASGKSVEIDDYVARFEYAINEYLSSRYNKEELAQRNQQLIDLENELKENLGLSSEDAISFTRSLQNGSNINFGLLNLEQQKRFEDWVSANSTRYGSTNWNEQIDINRRNPNLGRYETLANQSISSANKQQDILDILSTGDLSKLSEEQISYLDKLENEFQELANIQNQGSAEYLQKLREIKEQNEDNARTELETERQLQSDKVENLKTELQTLLDKKGEEGNFIEIKAKTDELEEELDKLAEIDRTIKVNIDADLESDVDDAFGLANQFDQLRTKINQDLELTYEEAQQLISNGYGAVLQNAEETANATIKLNKDVVNNYIDSKQSELQAQKETKIRELEAQREVLVAQQNALQKEITAYTTAAEAKDEVSAASALQEAQNAQNEYNGYVEQLNEKITATEDAANQQNEIDKSLYESLGGMATEAANTEQRASQAAAATEVQNALVRFNALKNVFNALSAIGNAVRESATGPVSSKYPAWKTAGAITGTTDILNGISQAAKNITKGSSIEAKDLSQHFTTGEASAAYKNTIAQLKRDAEARLKAVNDQIGSIDAGIAALRSADLSLDTYQGGYGSGGKSGKSGGGSSSKNAQTQDNIEKELDIYHDINIILKQISNELDKLDKQKDKLFGKPLIENLNKQISFLNKQIDATEIKVGIARGEASKLMGELSKSGIVFNKDGTIANYADAFTAKLNYTNATINQYNAMSATEQEGFKNTVEQAKKDFEKFTSNIERYDTVITELIPGLQADMQEALNKQISMNIEMFNMEVKLRLELSEAERDWNEFKRKIIDGIKDDDILGVATARFKDFFSYYTEEGTGAIQALTKQIEGTLEELHKYDAGGFGQWYGDDKSSMREDLKDYYAKLKDNLYSVLALEDELHKDVISMMSEAQSKFDEQVSTFENINKELEHNIELLNLITDQDDYEDLAKYYTLQRQNRIEELDFQTQQKDFWKNYLETLEEGSDEWKKTKESYEKSAEAWVSATKSAIDAARTEFENSANLIFQKLNNVITKGLGLEYINEQWTLMKDNSDLVLDNINRMEGLHDINQKYLDAINDSSSVTAQQRLNKLRESELDTLKNMDKLGQNDLDRAEKKLKIALAQIALEEAQRNKSQLQLKRDSQGNYSYVYTADNDAIDNARNNLTNAYQELYNFDKQKYLDNLNSAYSAWDNYQKKMAEAALINDPERRAEKEALLQKEYQEQIITLTEQNERYKKDLNESTFAELNYMYSVNADNYKLMTAEQQAALEEQTRAQQTAFDLVFEMYNENTEKFHAMTQAEKDIIETQMVPQWQSGVQAMIEAIEGEGGIAQVSKQLYDDLTQASVDYNNVLETIENTANKTFDSVKNAESETIEIENDLLDVNKELIDTYYKQVDAVMAVYNALEDMIKEYQSATKAAQDAYKAAYDYLHIDDERAAEEAKKNVEAGSSVNLEENAKKVEAVGDPIKAAPISDTAATVKAPTPAQTVFTAGSTATVRKGSPLYNAYGTRYPNSAFADRKVTVQGMNGNRYQVWGSTFNPHVVYVDKNSLFDTGGYTGEWGNNGRLAVLHQKELVLNKQDTANMLNAVNVLRTLTNNIGSDVLAKIASLKAPGVGISDGGSLLNQQVHIDATFPAVTSSLEIQDALNNLVNAAAQKIQER